MRDIDGIVFDKDGTLFGFQATWAGWCAGFIADLAEGDAHLAQALACGLGFDLRATRFKRSSPVIAGTMEAILRVLAACLPARDPGALRAHLLASSAAAEQVPAAPLAPLLDELRAAGLTLGLVTNDAEAPARAHLTRARVLDRFAFLAGYDSGHGAKPDPGQLHAFCAATGLSAARVLMVGDSTHDLRAGRAAGMPTVAVLTGPARARDLAPFADAVLDDISELPAWLGLARAPQPA